MRAKIVVTLLLAWCVPASALAASPVTRREGFLTLWQSIRRPVESVRETPFTDVSKGTPGYDEITYAKARGILNDDPEFHPDEPLYLSTALVWLLRTRNVAEPKEISGDTLVSLLQKYQMGKLISYQGEAENKHIDDHTITDDELTALMRTFDQLLKEEVHEVSNYGEKFQGKGTAFGETFDMYALTAAHRTLPYNTLVRVTSVRTGKQVVVRINDRGPYVEGRDMDLSVAAFSAIADGGTGIMKATFERLGDASLVGGCAQSPAKQTRITRDTRLIGGVPWNFPLGESLTLRSTRSFVVRDVIYPDGGHLGAEDWVNRDETFTFTPSIQGVYTFIVGSVDGRRREMTMNVLRCG